MRGTSGSPQAPRISGRVQGVAMHTATGPRGGTWRLDERRRGARPRVAVGSVCCVSRAEAPCAPQGRADLVTVARDAPSAIRPSRRRRAQGRQVRDAEGRDARPETPTVRTVDRVRAHEREDNGAPARVLDRDLLRDRRAVLDAERLGATERTLRHEVAPGRVALRNRGLRLPAYALRAGHSVRLPSAPTPRFSAFADPVTEGALASAGQFATAERGRHAGRRC